MKKKILSLILCAVMLFTAVACANPPGEGSGTRIDPGAGVSKDTTPVTESAPEAEPVDFSVLTEEELGKIDEALLAQLKEMSETDSVRVVIKFKRVLSDDERENLVEKQYEKNQERYFGKGIVIVDFIINTFFLDSVAIAVPLKLDNIASVIRHFDFHIKKSDGM